MEENKPDQVISDVSQPAQTSPQPQAQTQSNGQGLDTKTKSPVVSSKDNSNLKTTIVIVLAVVVALGLIGVGYVAFMMNTEGKEATQEPAASEQAEPAQVDQVDEATIDQDTTEIDGIVNQLDEEADLPADELNDENIGM